MAAGINERFASAPHPPIVLLVEHHQPDDIYEYYRAAEVCVVSSLHDGMNLVAKEFVASRDDERGVLILSQFTGASRELPEALIVNPYNIDQCAAALKAALTMPPTEQRTGCTACAAWWRNSTCTGGPVACSSTQRRCACAAAFSPGRTAGENSFPFAACNHGADVEFKKEPDCGGRRHGVSARNGAASSGQVGVLPRHRRHAPRYRGKTPARADRR